MNAVQNRGYGVIAASFLLAYLLSVVPLPGWLQVARPEWVALVLIYWVMALPKRMGIATAWGLGLVLDVLRGSLLGQHALAFSVIAFLSLQLYQRIRVFPLWQQSLTIGVLVAFGQILMLWVMGVSGQSPDTWFYWLSSISSMLLWPVVFLVLRNMRRKYNIA